MYHTANKLRRLCQRKGRQHGGNSGGEECRTQQPRPA